jgi:hypothetical protein
MQKMGKYEDNYDAIQWDTSEYTRKPVEKRGKSPYVLSDIEEFVSPVDKTVIGSRSQLREHERKHNIRQVGNDYTSSEKPKNWDNMVNER